MKNNLWNPKKIKFFQPVNLKKYPARTKSEWRLIDKNPWGDRDRDGVPNIFDCRPFDRRKQGKLLIKERQAAKRALIIGTAKAYDPIYSAKATKQLKEHLEKDPYTGIIIQKVEPQGKKTKISGKEVVILGPESAPELGKMMDNLMVDMAAQDVYAKDVYNKKYYELTQPEKNKVRRFIREVTKKMPPQEIKSEAEKFKQTEEFAKIKQKEAEDRRILHEKMGIKEKTFEEMEEARRVNREKLKRLFPRRKFE